MSIIIKQTIEKVADGEYCVIMKVGEEDEYTTEFNRSNAVFPAFRELTHALLEFEDCNVQVTTNSGPLATEFNSLPNPNATLLNNLKEVAARQGITLTIIYEDN